MTSAEQYQETLQLYKRKWPWMRPPMRTAFDSLKDALDYVREPWPGVEPHLTHRGHPYLPAWVERISVRIAEGREVYEYDNTVPPGYRGYQTVAVRDHSHPFSNLNGFVLVEDSGPWQGRELPEWFTRRKQEKQARRAHFWRPCRTPDRTYIGYYPKALCLIKCQIFVDIYR